MPKKSEEVLQARREYVLEVVSASTPTSRTKTINRLAESLFVSPKSIYADLEALNYNFPSKAMQGY